MSFKKIPLKDCSDIIFLLQLEIISSFCQNSLQVSLKEMEKLI